MYIENKLGDYIWKLTSVAIAAQVVTLPISLYYFHQFPVYFWLSGLVVIPAAIVVMSFAFILFLVFIVIPKLAFLPGIILYAILYLTNGLIFLISELPGATITGIWISSLGVLILYLSIGALIISIESKRTKWLHASVGLLLLFALSFSYHGIRAHQKSEIVFYHTNKNKTLIDVINQSLLWSIRNEELSDKDIDFIAKNYRTKLRVQAVTSFAKNEEQWSSEFFFKDHLIQFKIIKILIIDSHQIPTFQPKPKLDYILLENNTSAKLKDLVEYFETKKFILSANNSFYKIKQWNEEAVGTDRELIDIKNHGAFILPVD